MGKPRLVLIYELRDRFGGWWHSYRVVGEAAALELQVTEYPEDRNIETAAGLESHYRRPPEYMEGDAPSHDKCHALGGVPCWHDGTSLYATETWLPMWEAYRREPEMLLKALRREYVKKFCPYMEEEGEDA